MLLWVKSSDLINDGLLATWTDKSGLGNNLIQNNTSHQPSVVSNGFNGFSIVNFENTSKFLDFNRLTNIRSIYWVIRSVGTHNGYLLGDSSNYHFHSGGSSYFDTSLCSPSVRDGSFRINGQTVSTSVARSNAMTTLSLVTTGNVAASSFSADRNNQYGARSWQGHLLELAVYNTAHTEAEVNQMEAYLKTRYNHY